LLPNSDERIAQKLKNLNLNRSNISRRIQELQDLKDVRIRGIAKVIDDQLEPQAADNINRGVAQMLFIPV